MAAGDARMLLFPFFFIAGAAIGSFLVVAFDRLPGGGSITWPPSHCPDCGTRLRPLDLVPIASYLALRGKCRYCHARIPVHVLFGESASGVAAAAGFLLYEKIGFGEQLILIAISAATLTAFAILALALKRANTPMTVAAIIVAAAVAPFWSGAGALRPFPLVDGALASGLDALAAGAIAVGAYVAHSALTHTRRTPELTALAALAGMFAGLPGLAVALPVSLALVGGLWAVGKLRGASYPAPFPLLLAVCAVAALVAEPWADSLIW
jgi:prepilin signal peptidase PulO-like enzyme (type II secretory pathway)